MEETLRFSRKSWSPASLGSALGVLGVVWSAFHYVGDPMKAASIALSVGLLPALLADRTLLLGAAFFSFFAAQTDIPAFISIFGDARWYFLAACVLVAAARPVLFRDESPEKKWKGTRWMWIFLTFAFASAAYSISPRLTILRWIPLACLLFVGTAFVKPYVSSYGVEKAVNLLLYTAFPFYVGSILMAENRSAYFLPPENTTYTGLEHQELYNRALGLTGTGTWRFHGIFQNPNTIGLLTGLLFPMVLVKVIQDKNKMLPILMLLSMLFCVALSGSRDGLVLCVFTGSYVLMRLYEAKKMAKILFSKALPAAMLFLPLLLLALKARWLSSYLRLGTNLTLAGGRLEAWGAALAIIRLRPLLGYGFGTEDRLFRKFGFVFLYHEGAYAHNSYIGLAMQTGLIGALLLFVPLFILMAREFRVEKPSALRVGLQGMLAAALLGCLVESWIYSTGNAEALPFWIGVALLQYLRNAPPEPVSPAAISP